LKRDSRRKVSHTPVQVDSLLTGYVNFLCCVIAAETSARCLPKCCAGRSSLAITHVLCQKSCYLARERRISVVNSLHLRKIMLHISYVEEDGNDDLFATGNGKLRADRSYTNLIILINT